MYSHYLHKTLLFVLFLLSTMVSFSQADPVVLKKDPVRLKNDSLSAKKDTVPVVTKKAPVNKYDSAFAAHSPKQAALRSAILPGLGQIYNKKYWKLPIIYGAMGTCAGVFFFNLGSYKDTKFAYRVKFNMRVYFKDSALYASIKDNLKPLSENSLQFYRNQYRRDIDYSALFFLILWGLNVVDASVDAHLKSFDVSPDLSLRFRPGYSELAKTSGLSLVLKIGK